jgi:hypothetical protein
MAKSRVTNTASDFVVKLLELGEGSKLGNTMHLHNGIHSLKYGNIAKREALKG